MARISTNMVEQHLEKGILGLCALGLVFSLLHWVASSPRSVEMDTGVGRQSVSPSNIDAAVRDRAKQAKSQIEGMEPNVPPPPDSVKVIRDLQTKPLPPKYAIIDFGPVGPKIGEAAEPNIQKISPSELIDAIPRPGKPLVKADRELLNKPMEKLSEVLVAHVVATYPWKDLMEGWGEKLKQCGLIYYRPVILGVEGEVQEQQADGSWGPPRPVQKVTMPLVDSAGIPASIPEMPAYDGKNAVEIATLKTTLSDPIWQIYVIEPDFWQIIWPSYGPVSWLVNLPVTEISKAAAAEMASGAGGVAPMPGLSPSPMFPPYQPPMQTVSPMGQGLAPGMAGRGRMRREEEDDEGPRRRPNIAAPTPGQPPAVGLEAGPGAPGADPDVIVPTPTFVPSPEYQQQKNQLLVWFHDNSLVSSKVYRYRLRLKLLNPLLAFEDLVTNTSFAATPALLTRFSDWSDTVYVPQATEFFVVGAFPDQGSVSIDVFTRSLGQQVKQRFSVVQGQSIGQPRQIEQENPITKAVEKPTVDFSTASVAVEFAFTKPAIAGKGLAEMTYLDERGKLRTMTEIRRTDPRYKDLLEKTKLSAKAAGAAIAAAAATQPVKPAPTVKPPQGAETRQPGGYVKPPPRLPRPGVNRGSRDES